MIHFNLNGQSVEVDLESQTPLINVLRDHFGLFGTRYGCGQEACGACTVLIDGKASYACTVIIDELQSRSVQTVEGLGNSDKPHPLQKAFLEEQAGQCGFCLSGMLMKSAALLNSNSNPNENDIRNALNDNLCRCGVHNRIIRAVMAAAKEIRSNGAFSKANSL